jgi:small subunit ribosomal protein S18
MARNNDRDRGTRRAPKESARRGKKKVCIFCKDQISWVDYKEIGLLRKFMSDRGKIRARRVSGNCAQHQRDVALAIKTARELALLPYTQRTMSDRPGPRGPGPGAGRGPGGRGVPAPDAEGAPEPDDAPGLDGEVADEAVLAADEVASELATVGVGEDEE